MKVFNNAGKQCCNICFLLFIYLIVAMPNITNAADKNSQEASKVVPARRRSSDPYCGVYCLYTVIQLTGQEIDFKELVKPEYIGSRKGSSLAELEKAAKDYGLHALPAGKLTSKELSQSMCPIILHVKSKIGPEQYDHYEMFLGTENGKAKLFDPPNPLRLVSFAELAPRWNGNGLIVSSKPIDPGLVFGPGRRRLMAYVAAAIAAILSLHVAKRWLPRTLLDSRRKVFLASVGQSAGFAVVALVCGLIYHFASDGGLLANTDATAAIQKTHSGNFIPKIDERKVCVLLGGDTIFIDARFARDFKEGHLEGAISVPVDANDVERHKAIADIEKDADIVVYCQSAGCKFAEIVAIRLIEEGYSNISIFRGGWAQWVAKNGRPKETAI